MRVVVGKIEGVQSVKVRLKDGVATIQFAPSNRVTVEKIRHAIRSNGFTARGAEVQVAGSLEQRADTLRLVVPETGDVFVLTGAPGTGALAELRRHGVGARVTLAGLLPSSGGKKVSGPMPLMVRSVLTR